MKRDNKAFCVVLLLFCGVIAAAISNAETILVDRPTAAHGYPTAGQQSSLGQFGPKTRNEEELARMLDGDFQKIDLALANWLIAADIEEFKNFDQKQYSALLEQASKQVGQRMIQRMGERGSPASRCAAFCRGVIELGFVYHPDFREKDLPREKERLLHLDPNNTTLAGILRTRKGTCISMPMLYVAIGESLGLPVHLVAVGKHYFARWEEPGFRINIETTIVDKVAVTPDDSVYIESEGLRRDEVIGNTLHSLTKREVVGCLFFTRAWNGLLKGSRTQTQACLDLSRAVHLAPNDPLIRRTHKSVFQHYGIMPEHTDIEINILPKKGHQ